MSQSLSSTSSLSPPTVAIALCTYKGARYIVEQLTSIEQQTWLPDEVVVCDDASPDETVAIVQEFAKTSKLSIQVHCNPQNLGYVGNFSQAIALTRSDIIFLSDQDDLWQPEKIEKFVQEFQQYPGTLLVFGDANLVDGDLHPLGQTLWQALSFDAAEQDLMMDSHSYEFNLKRGCNIFSGALMALRREIKPVLLPVASGFPHDMWLGLLAAAIGKIRLVPEPLVNYRQHAQQASESKGGGFQRSLNRNIRAFKRLSTPMMYERMLQEHEQLRDRLVVIDTPLNPGVLELLNTKILYLQARLKMRQRFVLFRLPLVLNEYFSGRYARFSRGWRSILIDLVL